MNVEIIAIGSELLLGDVLDTNSSYIACRLAKAGLNSYYQSSVGDNHERIKSAFEHALSRSDAVICCGGLGPTQDDITRDVIADLMGVKLCLAQELANELALEFRLNHKREMPTSSLRQAMHPIGATLIDERPGAAAGLICPINVGEIGKFIYAVPGVPQEMKIMIDKAVIPSLKARSGSQQLLKSRILSTWGLSEAEIAYKLTDRIEQLRRFGNPTLAFLATGVGGIKIRITAFGSEPSIVDDLLETEARRLCEELREVVFSTHDESMEEVIVKELRQRGLTLCVVDTVLGGYVAERLNRVGGASEVLFGSVFVPKDDTLRSLLGSNPFYMPEEDDGQPAVKKIKARLGADIGLVCAAHGNDQASLGISTGQLRLTVALPEETIECLHDFPFDAESRRQFSCITLLNILRTALISRPELRRKNSLGGQLT